MLPMVAVVGTDLEVGSEAAPGLLAMNNQLTVDVLVTGLNPMWSF